MLQMRLTGNTEESQGTNDPSPQTYFISALVIKGGSFGLWRGGAAIETKARLTRRNLPVGQGQLMFLIITLLV